MLASRIRPTNLDDVIGQDHLVGENGIVRRMLEQNKVMSMVLYGDSGCGKTTIARIIVSEIDADFLEINATNSNKKDLDEAIAFAKLSENFILIIDEIHRLNKDKQDILLPHVESGLIKLIGITNANPFFALNSALRSRVILLELKNIEICDMSKFINKTIENTKLATFNEKEDLVNYIVKISNKDIRYALNQLELLDIIYKDQTSIESLVENITGNVRFDKNESNFYNVISALQKSIRGSDVNAALFYLAILIISGDLDIIERRIIVCAYEDVGLADPQVVDRVYHALKAARMVGFPEARIPLAFCVIDLCLASKSNRAYIALDKAIDLVKKTNYEIQDYLQASPQNQIAKENYWKIPYENKHLISYLPANIKKVNLYNPIGKSSYEQHLKKLNDYLNEITRTDDLEKLIKKLKI